MNKNFKVVVTGANGFIGTHVLLQGMKLFPELHWIATSSRSEVAPSRPWFGKALFIQYNYHTADHNFPFSFSEHDIMIHSAWGFLPHFKKEEHLTTELPAQKKFLHTCIKSGLKNLTVLGTCYEYGMQEGCLNEEKNPSDPVTPYPKAKVELYQWITRNFPHIHLTWMRLFYMYGEGQSEKSLIPQLKKALSENRKSFDMSKGDQIRDYQPVEKMAEKIVHIAVKKLNAGIVNICSGNPIRVLDLVKNYLKKNQKEIILNTGVYPYPDYEPFAFWGCPEKMNQLLKS